MGSDVACRRPQLANATTRGMGNSEISLARVCTDIQWPVRDGKDSTGTACRGRGRMGAHCRCCPTCSISERSPFCTSGVASGMELPVANCYNEL